MTITSSASRRKGKRIADGTPVLRAYPSTRRWRAALANVAVPRRHDQYRTARLQNNRGRVRIEVRIIDGKFPTDNQQVRSASLSRDAFGWKLEESPTIDSATFGAHLLSEFLTQTLRRGLQMFELALRNIRINDRPRPRHPRVDANQFRAKAIGQTGRELRPVMSTWPSDSKCTMIVEYDI